LLEKNILSKSYNSPSFCAFHFISYLIIYSVRYFFYFFAIANTDYKIFWQWRLLAFQTRISQRRMISYFGNRNTFAEYTSYAYNFFPPYNMCSSEKIAFLRVTMILDPSVRVGIITVSLYFNQGTRMSCEVVSVLELRVENCIEIVADVLTKCT